MVIEQLQIYSRGKQPEKSNIADTYFSEKAETFYLELSKSFKKNSNKITNKQIVDSK